MHFVFLRLTCSLQKVGQLFPENWESNISINNVDQFLIC